MRILITLALLGFGLLFKSTASETNVTGNACSCSQTSFGGIAECVEIPMADFPNAFNCPMEHIYLLNLKPSQTDNIIPADLLGGKQVSTLSLSCPTPDYPLRVDAGAFQSTRNFTNFVTITKCDLSQLDFAFLTGFDNLTNLEVSWSTNLHQSFATLPALPNLYALNILACSGLEDLVNFPILVNGLNTFFLANNTDLRDETVGRILNWILSSSAQTLQKLELWSNPLMTKIPEQIKSFRKLSDLQLYDNSIPVITTGSLSFSSPVQYLYLHHCGINTIEPDAFQGDFSSATVDLYDNNLTRFDEFVFQDLLKQMSRDPRGLYRVDLAGNPFDCSSDPCHLAWFIRDNNKPLWAAAHFGQCSNGTYFFELSMKGFNQCPIPVAEFTEEPEQTTTPIAATSSTTTTPSKEIVTAAQPSMKNAATRSENHSHFTIHWTLAILVISKLFV